MKVIDGFKNENLHFRWSPANIPVEHVSPGETLTIKIPDSSTKQIQKDFNSEDLKKIDDSKVDAAVGPVYVDGAEKGDTLKIEIKSIEVGTWGWSAIMKDFGALSPEFDDRLVIWDINKTEARCMNKGFLDNVKIPINPFLGIIGTAPGNGEFGMIPPRNFGGNMDNKFLGAGSVLYLPVNVNGALLSFADPHASQGDGEVCGTAIETSCTAVVKVDLIKGKAIKYPRIESRGNAGTDCIISMGIEDSLEKSAKAAIWEMIGILSEYGFSREEAYILCSVAGNLKISEMVDMPDYVVSMELDKNTVSSRNASQ